MEQYVGLDVSLESTSICVVDAAGAVEHRVLGMDVEMGEPRGRHQG